MSEQCLEARFPLLYTQIGVEALHHLYSHECRVRDLQDVRKQRFTVLDLVNDVALA